MLEKVETHVDRCPPSDGLAGRDEEGLAQIHRGDVHGAVDLGIFTMTLLSSQISTALHDGRHAAGARLRCIRRTGKSCAFASAKGEGMATGGYLLPS
jgi:hypothetical protein